MAILNKVQLLEKIKTQLGESVTDEALQLVEDISDTMSHLEAQKPDTKEWENKVKETEDKWRKKYRDRFFSSKEEEDTKSEPETPPQTETAQELTYENLFKN